MQDERVERTEQEKQRILELFRQKGLRVTKQRELILDIVLENECTCCKEIYYRASKKDKDIGIATVYRMLNSLNELGVFRANELYSLSYQDSEGRGGGCRVVLKNQRVVELNQEEWYRALKAALAQKGYPRDLEIEQVIMKG